MDRFMDKPLFTEEEIAAMSAPGPRAKAYVAAREQKKRVVDSSSLKNLTDEEIAAIASGPAYVAAIEQAKRDAEVYKKITDALALYAPIIVTVSIIVFVTRWLIINDSKRKAILAKIRCAVPY
jgi:F0F1-type ATP synthase membrane subunit c/vacuolar-type H+-ATPase subunit K